MRAVAARFGWRAWLSGVGALFAAIGALTAFQAAQVGPAWLWLSLWVPAGLTAVLAGLTGRPPGGAFYMAVPAAWSAGAVARATAIVAAEAALPLSALVWLALAATVGPAWARAVPVSPRA